MVDLSAQAFSGTQLGRYHLRYKVAQGGMAAVYLAQLEGTRGFERWVAIKIIHPHLGEERRFVDMLLDEARVAARIHHPNVCSVLDFGESGGVPYLVMEYLHGETLSAVIRRRRTAGAPLEPWLVARVVLDAANGLHAAHELTDRSGSPLGVVHRDVSPQNIVTLYDGVTKVVDFGIARARGRLTSTEAGELKGKFSYMAPEQLEGEDVDRRADVWALGVVLWEATTGTRLFRADAGGKTVANVLAARVPRPSEIVPDYPKALEAIVLSALTRDPARRTPSADALGEALEGYLSTTGTPSGHRRVARFMRTVFAEKLGNRERMLQAEPPADEVSVIDLESGSIQSEVRVAAAEAPAEVPQLPTTIRPGPPDPDERGGASATVAEAVAPADDPEGGGASPIMSEPPVAIPGMSPLVSGRALLWGGAILVLALVIAGVAFVLPGAERLSDGPASDDAAAVADRGDVPADDPAPAVEPSGASDVEPSGDGADSTDLASSAEGSEVPVDTSEPATTTADELAAGEAQQTPAGSEAEPAVADSEPEPAVAESEPAPALAEPRRPSKRAAARQGTLVLHTSLPATVYEERELLGRTPLTIRLDPGAHTLRVHPVGGGAPRSVQVTVRAGQRVRRDVELSPY